MATPPGEVIAPMLATLRVLPSGSGRVIEFKWDGVRTIGYLDRRGLTLMSRNNIDVTSRWVQPVVVGDP